MEKCLSETLTYFLNREAQVNFSFSIKPNQTKPKLQLLVKAGLTQLKASL